MYIEPRLAISSTSQSRAVASPVNTSQAEAPTSAPEAPQGKDALRGFDFESMTVGELNDTLNELFFSGRITFHEMCDVGSQYERFWPDLTLEQSRAMPLKLSYAELKEDIAFARTSGDTEYSDRLTRVLDILQRFEGRPRGIDVKA